MSHNEIQAERLTIYCTEVDRHGGKPLHQWLLNLAMELGLGGTTITKAIEGYGQHRQLHHQHILAIADELPMVIQIIDTTENIDAFLNSTGDALHGYTYIRENVKWHVPNT